MFIRALRFAQCIHGPVLSLLIERAYFQSEWMNLNWLVSWSRNVVGSDRILLFSLLHAVRSSSRFSLPDESGSLGPILLHVHCEGMLHNSLISRLSLAC